MKTVLTEKYNFIDSSIFIFLRWNTTYDECFITLNCNLDNSKMNDKFWNKLMIKHKCISIKGKQYVIYNNRILGIRKLFICLTDKLEYEFNFYEFNFKNKSILFN